MEKALLKLARQLNAYDEASLMSLWEKYSEAVQRFEPSKRWEEAVLVLSMIQGVRFKNQLFNHHWAASRTVGEGGTGPEPVLSQDIGFDSVPPQPSKATEEKGGSARPAGGNGGGKGGKLLRLTPRKD